MAFDIISRPFWRLPQLVDDDAEDWLGAMHTNSGGLSVSEDDKHVYITAALPGVDEADIDVTFDKGVVWIKGESKVSESDAKRKYYRKASSSYAYSVTVPGDIDTSLDPEATYKNGVMTVTFVKSPTSQPKKITIKGHK